MSNKEKINVSFVNYMPDNDIGIPDTHIDMGQITSAQLNAILAEFTKNAPGPHSCIKTLNFEFQDSIHFSWPQMSRPTQWRRLELSDMFRSYNIDTHRITPPCMIGKRAPRSEDAMVHVCAQNLRCGKCKDAFIRRTLGAALFPQFYEKDKQK